MITFVIFGHIMVALIAGGGALVVIVGQRRRHLAAMVRDLARKALLRCETAEQADRSRQQQRNSLHRRLHPARGPPLSKADHCPAGLRRA
ncbi:hypothetical protein EOA33_13725 [Mesorhizobium sp. M4A.F.Ca.ET.050.02.1.1]|nr:hypothetical protein EOA33_13725 [Mesorhizobium sp. M4A.F.Ca.ET.050.02.1.1]